MLLPVVLVVLESPVLPVVELPPAPPVVDSLLELAVEFPIPPIPVAATELEDDAELPPVVELAAPFVAELVEFDELEVEELAGPLLVSDALVAVPMVGPVGPALGPCAVKPLPVVVSLFGEVSTTVAQDAISSDVPTAKARHRTVRLKGTSGELVEAGMKSGRSRWVQRVTILFRNPGPTAKPGHGVASESYVELAC